MAAHSSVAPGPPAAAGVRVAPDIRDLNANYEVLGRDGTRLTIVDAPLTAMTGSNDGNGTTGSWPLVWYRDDRDKGAMTTDGKKPLTILRHCNMLDNRSANAFSGIDIPSILKP
jgi:hypothetical protein